MSGIPLVDCVHSNKHLTSLLWRHNDRGGVSDHQPHDCLLNRLFRRRSKKTSKLRVTGLCVGNSPGTGEFPAQRASNSENASIWWRHHVGSSNKGNCVALPQKYRMSPLNAAFINIIIIWFTLFDLECYMVTSCHGNLYSIAYPLGGGSTDHSRIPLRKTEWSTALVFSMMLVWKSCRVQTRVSHDLKSKDTHVIKRTVFYRSLMAGLRSLIIINIWKSIRENTLKCAKLPPKINIHYEHEFQDVQRSRRGCSVIIWLYIATSTRLLCLINRASHCFDVKLQHLYPSEIIVANMVYKKFGHDPHHFLRNITTHPRLTPSCMLHAY